MVSKAGRMIPKKPVLGLDPRMDFRFSDKIMRKQNVGDAQRSA
jgi:hypothetical protein